MGLIAHYRLDGSAEDAVGGNHGTVVGGVSWVDGKIGQCGNFDQTKISVGKPIPTNGSPFSISVWINPFSAMGSTHSSFINDGASKWDNGFTMYVRQSPGADLNVNFVTEDGRRFWGSGGTFNYDKFNHVVYTFDGKNGRTYVNGELAAVQGESLGTYNGGDLQIGYGVLGHWKGLIDDVRIYDHALSPREVRDLSLGLVSHFPMLKDEWGSHGTSSPVVVNAALLEEGGFEFTGSNSYIDLGSDQNFVGKADNSPLTVCAWIKPSAFSTRDMILSKNPNRSSSNYSYMFGLVSGNMNAYTGSTWRAFSTKGLISIGKWAHVAWVFDGTTLKGYVNGELVGSRSDFAYTNKEPSTVKIGGYHTSSDFHGTIKDHRVYSNPLTGEQIKELAQQRVSIDSEGSVHTPTIQQNPRARYIRDWTNGSTSNGGNHWLEVRAVYAGENISLGKPITASGSATNLSKVTDGTTSTSGYATVRGTGPAWVQVDLEEVREIDEVQVWHYNSDKRTYYDTKTEISEDGINWTTIFDSAVSDTYQETPSGVTHQAKALGPIGATPHGLRLPDVSEIGVARGLVAWYPLIGDTLDYAGTNHAVNNGAVATAEGYEFDGGSYLLLQPPVDPHGDFSLSFVATILGATTATLFCSRTALGKGLTMFRINAGSIRFDVGGQWTTTVTPVVGAPTAITVTKQGTTASIFLNGEFVASRTLGAVENFNPTLASIGASQISGGTYGNYLIGTLRDYRFHNVALTPEEVAIQAKLALNPETKSAMTQSCLYTNGQIKEVIA